MNFRKSLLSLAAVLALSSTVTADDTATYMPLASDTADSGWILFGVNGFSDGTPSDLISVASAFTPPLDSLEDTDVDDELATSGLNGWASVQALQTDTTLTITTLLVGIDTTGTPDATEAMRSMYVRIESEANPVLKLDYRGSLEDQVLEILLNGDLYSTTISQDYTWSNPAVAIVGSTPAAGNSRVAITEVLDYNLTNNPVDAKHFDKDVHLDIPAVGTGAASFYYFNALTQQWEINQRGAPAEAQDFINFNVGKAYWGRVDVDDELGALNSDTDGSAGIVLGDATAINGIPDPDRYQDDLGGSTLTPGWNLLSFDDNKPYIRHAATGLVLTTVADGDVLRITDASGLNTITTPAIANGGNELDAIRINATIESAKLRGLLPESFNLKVFRGSIDTTLIILSDEMFTVEDTNAAGSIEVVTLFGLDPYVNGNPEQTINDLGVAAAVDVATSAYGEYAMLTHVLTGTEGTGVADTIAGNTGGFSKVSYTESGQTVEDIIPLTVVGASTLAQAKTNFENALLYTTTTVTPFATQIDTDFNGVADMLIVASTKPFVLEDATYHRVFNVGASAVNVAGDSITIKGSANVSVTPVNGSSAAVVAILINDQNATTKVFAAPDIGGQQIILASTDASLLDLKDADSGVTDVIEHSSSSDLTADGAVSGVYALDTITRLPINQVILTSVGGFTTNGSSVMMDVNDSYELNATFNDGTPLYDSGPTAIAGTAVDTWGEYLAMLDTMVDGFNAAIAAGNAHGFAAHTLSLTEESVVAGDTLTTSTTFDHKIVTIGVDLNASNIELVNYVGGADTVDPSAYTIDGATTISGDNNLSIGSGNIITDLKANPAFTPNYAIYGPLYTLRESGTGYDARAILKATTDMDVVNGAIAWDSIDLTRNEDQWFDNNEYNLFNINHNSGYWVYLEDKSADDIVVSATATFSGAYTYYFSNDSSTTPAYQTTNVINNGQFTITITGLADVIAGSAYAVIGAEEVSLKRSGATNDWTATISNYGLKSFAEGSIIAVKVRAVSGMGKAVSVDTVAIIDYEKPTSLTATINGGTNIDLAADAGTTSKFYVFEDNIPELESTRDAYILANPTAEITAVGDAASFNACALYDYGVENTLRIVAADKSIDISNLSDADQIIYASLLKEANVLAHDPSSTDLKAQAGNIYDANCTLSSTQTGTTNSGVSVASLDSNNVIVARISFQPIVGSTFDQSTAWTSNYEINNGDGAIIQVQNTTEYAGKTFFLEYNNVIYSGTFPATQILADATIVDPTNLAGTFSAENTTLVP